jgi:citrate synthase
MMDDLVGKVSYFQTLILNATGRLPDRRLADWIEAYFICMSWPDSRIWCNQIGALGGAMRASAVSAAVAGILASDSHAYGPFTVIDGSTFIRSALEKSKNGLSARQIVDQECARYGGKPYIMGYARPIAKGDERIVAMERVSANLGFSVGEHLAMAYEIEKVMMEAFNESMNIGGYGAAFWADQGYSPEDCYRVFSVVVNSGVTACYADSMERPAETFLPMRCSDIDYQGKPSRTVPGKA